MASARGWVVVARAVSEEVMISKVVFCWWWCVRLDHTHKAVARACLLYSFRWGVCVCVSMLGGRH